MWCLPHTMMRYLQFDTLDRNGHRHFDNWAADFGEKVTAMELKPEGTGFRSKTRFAKFYNLPELISIWKEAADIQTADMLKLPVPEAEYITVTTEPSGFSTPCSPTATPAKSMPAPKMSLRYGSAQQISVPHKWCFATV